MTKLDIAVRKDKETWRDTGDIIDEVAAKWSSFTDLEKNAISTSMAGVRQKNIFITAMENYDKVLKLTTVSEESAGLSAKRMAAYQDSVAGKTATLTSTIESLYQTMLNSEFIKFLLYIATAVVSITGAFGGWSIIIPSVIILMTKFGQTAAFASNVLALNKTMVTSLIKFIPGLSSVVGFASTALQGLGLSAGFATAALEVLFPVALIALLVQIPTIIDAMTSSYEELTASVDEAAAALANTRSEYEKLLAKNVRTDEEQHYIELLEKEIILQEHALDLAEQKAYAKKYGGPDTLKQAVLAMKGVNKKGVVAGDGSFTTETGDGSAISKTTLIKSDLSDITSLTAKRNAATDINQYQKLDAQLLKLETTYASTYKELSGYKNNPEIELTNAQLEFMVNYEARLAEEASKTTEEVEKQADGFTTVTNVFAKLNSNLEETSSLYSEMETNGYLSIKTVMGLIESGSEYVNLLTVENGQFKLNQSAMEAMFAAEKAGAIAELTIKKGVIEADIAATRVIIENIRSKIQSLQGYGAAYALINNQAKEVNLGSQLNTVNNALNALSHITLKNYTSSVNGAAKATGGLSDAVQAQIDLLEVHRKSDEGVYDKLIKQLEEANDLLDKQNEANEKAIALAKARQALLDAQNQKNTRVYTSKGWDWVSDPSAVKSATDTLNGLENESALDSAKASNQAQIDKWTDEKERRDQYYDEKIAALKGYSNGGEVNFTGAAMLHGGDKPEYVMNGNEYSAFKGMMGKMGLQGVSLNGSSGGSGVTYAIYGDINVKAENQETFTSILQTATAMVKTGR